MPLLLVGVYSAVIVATVLAAKGQVPYILDGNESYGTVIHGQNLLDYGSKAAFLTDESSGKYSAQHPIVHLSQGNWPRLPSALLARFGFESPLQHVLILTFTIGVLGVWLLYDLLRRVVSWRFAALTTLLTVADYLFFVQWQVNAYRIWQPFLLTAALWLAAWLTDSRRKVLGYAGVGAVFFLLGYGELVFGVFSLLAFALLLVFMRGGRCRRITGFGLASAVLGFVAAIGVLSLQGVAYLGWSNYLAYFASTIGTRTLGAGYAQTAMDLSAEYNLVFWQNFGTGQGLIQSILSTSRWLATLSASDGYFFLLPIILGALALAITGLSQRGRWPRSIAASVLPLGLAWLMMRGGNSIAAVVTAIFAIQATILTWSRIQHATGRSLTTGVHADALEASPAPALYKWALAIPVVVAALLWVTAGPPELAPVKGLLVLVAGLFPFTTSSVGGAHFDANWTGGTDEARPFLVITLFVTATAAAGASVVLPWTHSVTEAGLQKLVLAAIVAILAGVVLTAGALWLGGRFVGTPDMSSRSRRLSAVAFFWSLMLAVIVIARLFNESVYQYRNFYFESGLFAGLVSGMVLALLVVGMYVLIARAPVSTPSQFPEGHRSIPLVASIGLATALILMAQTGYTATGYLWRYDLLWDPLFTSLISLASIYWVAQVRACAPSMTARWIRGLILVVIAGATGAFLALQLSLARLMPPDSFSGLIDYLQDHSRGRTIVASQYPLPFYWATNATAYANYGARADSSQKAWYPIESTVNLAENAPEFLRFPDRSTNPTYAFPSHYLHIFPQIPPAAPRGSTETSLSAAVDQSTVKSRCEELRAIPQLTALASRTAAPLESSGAVGASGSWCLFRLPWAAESPGSVRRPGLVNSN